MTPVARAVVAFVLVAGAGPAGFLIYHAVFAQPPAASAGGLGHRHPRRLPRPFRTGAADRPPASRGTPLTLPATMALPDSNGTHRIIWPTIAAGRWC